MPCMEDILQTRDMLHLVKAGYTQGHTIHWGMQAIHRGMLLMGTHCTLGNAGYTQGLLRSKISTSQN
ncbi:hypothetical protein JB92DRAFT_2908936 [Gautieria morchelliformis]|nr:hypothetical protein JB92DRAFT_2908936 [Gautieria morchelliformis]